MAIEFEEFGNEPILYVTLTEPFSVAEETGPMMARMAAMLDAHPGQLYCIYDTSGLTVAFSDMMFGLAEQAKGGAGSVKDNRLFVILVGTDAMITLAAQAMEQSQYGGLHIPLFDNRPDALAYARKSIANGSPA